MQSKFTVEGRFHAGASPRIPRMRWSVVPEKRLQFKKLPKCEKAKARVSGGAPVVTGGGGGGGGGGRF